jgi:hypothetical protein
MKVIWESKVTADMVAGWSNDEVELLIADLDDAVMLTLNDYEKDGN